MGMWQGGKILTDAVDNDARLFRGDIGKCNQKLFAAVAPNDVLRA